LLRKNFLGPVLERLRALRNLLGGNWGRLIAPAIVPLALLPFALLLVYQEVSEPLFGDTGYMQYLAWGIRHGMKIYRDMGSTDGPFIHFGLALTEVVFGQTDHALRVGDMVLQIGASGLIGALLAPRRGLNGISRWVSIVVWTGVSVTIWLAYYLVEPWAVTASREGYYCAVGCAGMVALYKSGTLEGRANLVAAFLGGAAVTSMCFGKPTGVIFTCMGALSLLVVEPELVPTRRLRIRWALYGALACVGAFVLGLALFGSFRGYFFWSVELPYVGNKFIWRMDWLKLVLLQYGDVRALAIGALLVGACALAWRLLPGRAVGFVLSPVLHWLSFCAQGRGFPHQALPVVATTFVLALVLAANLWERGSESEVLGILAPVTLALMSYHAFGNFDASPYRWNGDRAAWGQPVNSFCNPEKLAGGWLKAHTSPDDSIFAYTPGPRGDNAALILFYAERRTASPYHYAPWLDPVELLPESEIKPTKKELVALKALERKTRHEACSAVMRHLPAAIVYVTLNRMLDVCPPVRGLLERDYHEAKVFDDIHIYVSNANP
jgi:hypothetical protein